MAMVPLGPLILWQRLQHLGARTPNPLDPDPLADPVEHHWLLPGPLPSSPPTVLGWSGQTGGAPWELMELGRAVSQAGGILPWAGLVTHRLRVGLGWVLTQDLCKPVASGVPRSSVARRDPQGEGQPAPSTSFLDEEGLQGMEAPKDVLPSLVHTSPEQSQSPCSCW